MGLHLDLMVEGEEAPEKGKGLLDDILGHAVVLDVEEAAFTTGVADLTSDPLPRLGRAALQVGEVHGRD